MLPTQAPSMVLSAVLVGVCAVAATAHASALIQLQIDGTVVDSAPGDALANSDFALGRAVSLTYIFDETVFNTGNGEFGFYSGALLAATITTDTGTIQASDLVSRVTNSGSDVFVTSFDTGDADVATIDTNGFELQFSLQFFDFDGSSLDSSSLIDALTESRVLGFDEHFLALTEITGDFAVNVELDLQTLSITSVPAPGAIGLLGCSGMFGLRRHRR